MIRNGHQHRIPRKLNELGFIGRGRSRHRPRNDPSLYDGAYPFFQTGDIKAANLYLKNYSQTYNERGLAQSKLWDPGTLCITIAANIAETAVLDIPGCFPDSVVGFIANEDEADTKFVKYYIDFIKLRMQNISRGTTQDNLSLDKLLTFDFLVPPLCEQRQIAGILSAYDDLIENNTRRIKVLEEMARALYREWFVHFRFPGHEHAPMVDSPAGLIPEGWEVVALGDLYDTSSGGTPSRKQANYYGGKVAWVKTRELRDGFVLSTEESITELGLAKSSAKIFPPNTVLIAMYGATIGKLGILALSACTNQACCALLPKDESFDHAYAYFTLHSHYDDLVSLGAGAAQQNISQKVIKDFPILRPRAHVVAEWGTLVNPMLEQVRVMQQKNVTLRQTRDLLLPKLISGKIDVSQVETLRRVVSPPGRLLQRPR